MASLDFLDDNDETTVQPAANEAAKPELVKNPDQDTEESSQSDEDVHNSAEVDGRTVPLPALHSERKKRQEAERRLAELKEEYEREKQAKNQAESQPEEDLELSEDEVLSDLGGAFKKVNKKIERIERHYAEARIRDSIAHARDRYEDYDDVMKNYNQAIKEDPALALAVGKADAPALTAYKLMKKWEKDKEENDPALVRKKFDEAVSKKVQEELRKYGYASAADIPPTLANSRGTGAKRNVEPSVSDGDLFEEMFPRRR